MGRKIDEYFSPPPDYEETIKEVLSKEIDDDETSGILSRLSNYILEISQDCPLFCTYCVYSGDYQYYRPHGSKGMSLQTAQKAIDFFYNQTQSPLRNERKPRLMISFYGGESLLLFDIVMNSVAYAKKHRNVERVSLQFSLSTNGVLLTPEVVKTLVENQIAVAISLDGPESEHDRFRVFKNGRGSFSKIMENVTHIKREYPNYYENSVSFIATLHPFHDLKKIEEFFLSHETLFKPEKVRVNDLKTASLTNTEWLEAREELLMQKKTKLKKDRWFYKKIFCEPIENAIGEKETKFLSTMKNFTRSCFPGSERLLIDPDGNFHICEKINRYFPIGNLDQGFDIQKIKSLFQQWRKKTLELECWKCLILYFCSFCYAGAGVDGTLVIKKEKCRELEEKLSERIYDYLMIKEEEDEKIISNHDLDVPGFLDSL